LMNRCYREHEVLVCFCPGGWLWMMICTVYSTKVKKRFWKTSPHRQNQCGTCESPEGSGCGYEPPTNSSCHCWCKPNHVPNIHLSADGASLTPPSCLLFFLKLSWGLKDADQINTFAGSLQNTIFLSFSCLSTTSWACRLLVWFSGLPSTLWQIW
jgi:hypothetical protein